MPNKISIISLLCCVLFNVDIFAQEYVELTYSDTYEVAQSNMQNLPMLNKSLRKNAGSPSIIISGDAEFNEQTSNVIDYVMSVWESHIVNGVNLNVKIELSNSIVEDIQTVVRYQVRNDVLYPVALNAYMDNSYERENPYEDGIIRINSNTVWDYALGDNISPSGKNLALGLMRAMARIMGFGSTVSINDNGDYYFVDKTYHSIFNTLVSNSSNKNLTSIDINNGKPNSLLKSYIEESNQSFWITANNGKYKLASSPYSYNNVPFAYLEQDSDNASLMSANLSTGTYVLQIDETTQDILNSLGWNTQKPASITIIGEDVPETGLASAYESHRFTISKKDISITNPQWTLNIPDSNGDLEIITLKDEGLSCTTPPITDENKYIINSDGEIEAQLFFTCVSNGQVIKTPPFKIYFELKPIIEYATILDIHDNAPYVSYDATYKVKYRGTDRIKVSVEEEYGSKVKSRYINEPYIAFGTADHITSPYYAWIDFIAENEYGKSIYTIELQPYGVTSNVSTIDNANRLEHSKLNQCHNDVIEVYNMTGTNLDKNLEIFTPAG